MSQAGYNERLFGGGGVRAWFHLARFQWLRWATGRFAPQLGSVVELGCFDARSIEFLPRAPRRYVGLDADWEQGLVQARRRWACCTGFSFHRCETPGEMRQATGDKAFDVGLCLETLEHVPPHLVAPFIEALSRASREYVFITVPNEMGPVFLVKHAIKRVGGDYPVCSFKEVVGATVGKTEWVQRCDHKGFDYRGVLSGVRASCHVVYVSGYPFRWLPPALNFGIGIVAIPR
jgi:hypothetical protein